MPRRTPTPRRFAAALACAVSAMLAACTTVPSELSLPKVELPKVSVPDVKLSEVKLPDVQLPKLPKVSGPAVGTPTEVYTRVARGALLCWFGGNGPLKGTYVYFADAAPPSKGGRAEISIHAREDQASPRGNRVYHISIAPESDRAVMTIENIRLPDALAQQLQEDAQRWAASEEDVACRDEAIAQGWDPKATAAQLPANASNSGAATQKKPAKTAVR